MSKIIYIFILSVMLISIGFVTAADTTITTDVSTNLDTKQGLLGPYWISNTTGIIILLDSGNDLTFSNTTDAGSSWSETQIVAGEVITVASWFDKETPGDFGNLVHIVWLDDVSNDAFYVNVDISDGTIGTIRTIDSGLTVDSAPSFNRIALTKTISGNLLMALSTQTEIESYRSIDNGVTWVDRADSFETPTEEDWLLLYPANTGDDNDVAGIFWDRSASQISIKMYDDSGDSWTETTIDSAMTASFQYINMDASVRHSDNHILLTAHRNDDSVTDEIRTYDLTVNSIASPTITSKTNVVINIAESAQCAVLINQQNDDAYVAYLKGGTWENETEIVFHKSDDGMSTWGSEQAYSEATVDDNRIVHGGRTVGSSGGRIQWSWFNDDLEDIFVNLVNDINIESTDTCSYISGNWYINAADNCVNSVVTNLNENDVIISGAGSFLLTDNIINWTNVHIEGITTCRGGCFKN